MPLLASCPRGRSREKKLKGPTELEALIQQRSGEIKERREMAQTQTSERVKVLVSMTCFLDFEKEDKWVRAQSALDSILAHHADLFSTGAWTWLVVNEFSESPRRSDWTEVVHTKYPFIRFVQKDVHARGQAASLNIILRELRSADYTHWVHWEEAWVARRECIGRAMDVLRNEPAVSRVQMTRSDVPADMEESAPPDWLNLPPISLYKPAVKKRVPASRSTAASADVAYSIISTGSRAPWTAFMRRTMFLWPVFSLRPSVMKAAAFVDPKVGFFNEDPRAWPWRFEHELGERWELAGGRAAVLDDAPVIRSHGNCSISASRAMGGWDTAKSISAARFVLACLACVALFLLLRAFMRTRWPKHRP